MTRTRARGKRPAAGKTGLTRLQKTSRDWNETRYRNDGFRAQRLYPNEELLRFLGREWFSKTTRAQRKSVKVLELGCGSCANLWMIAREGFDAHGIDITPSALRLGRRMLANWGVGASLTQGSITALPYPDASFDAVVDVFSAYSLCSSEFELCLDEVARVLKPGGLFFSYTPSVTSDAFKSHAPAKLIDRFTLNGIHRKTSAYAGNPHPHRFTSVSHFKRLLESRGLRATYLETVGRTYRGGRERFEFVVAVGKKK